MTQLHMRYEGRVQGVGFRATVFEISRGFAVTGHVCNVSDGSVELVCEGEDRQVMAFQRAIHERLDRYIRHAHERWSESESGWKTFRVAPDKLV